MKQDIRAFYKPKFRGKRFPSFHSGSLGSVMLGVLFVKEILQLYSLWYPYTCPPS